MSAYGGAALTALRDAVRTAKDGDPLAPVTVLVPNEIAGVVARRFLVRGLTDGEPGIAALFPTTIRRRAEQLAASSLHPRRPATAPVVAASWRAALAKEPGLFGPVAEHPATVEALVRASHELRDVDDVALDSLSAATGLGPDLVRLYRDVQAGLSADWYDETDLLHRATDICRQQPARAAAVGAVVLYLPQALTQAEAGFVRALAAGGRLQTVPGLTGNAKADAAVLRSLERVGLQAPADTEPRTAAPALRTATRVLTASDADDEVRCVVREVVTVLEKAPAHRVAILYAAQNPYARLLHEHLGAADVLVNGPGTRPVHERAMARAVLELLDLGPHGMPRGDVFRVLAAAPMHAADGERIPVSRWERLSRAAGVVGGDDWDLRLQRYCDDHRAALADVDDDARPGLRQRLTADLDEAARLRLFVLELRARLRRGAELTSWSSLGEWALDLVHALIGEADELRRLPREEKDAAAAVEQALRTLSTLDSLGGTASLAALREALATQLESALPRVGRFGDGVLVAPVSAAIGLDADVVFVLGLAEAVFPGRLREDPLLPEPARNATAGQLLSYRERIDAHHRHVLAAFAAAEQVVASFPRGDLRTKSRHLPCRWLLPTLRRLSGRPHLSATKWDRPPTDWLTTSPSFAGSLTSTGTPATEQEWRSQAAHAGVPVEDDVLAAARTLQNARKGDDFTRFDGNLSAEVDGLPDFGRGQTAVSPTSLESYARCPHAYFVQRLLKVQPVEQPEDLLTISAADIGNLMHEAFDALVTEFQGRLPGYGEPWTDEQKDRLTEIAADLADRFAAAGRTGHPRLWQQTLVRIQSDLQAMLAADDVWRAELRARVVASELPFGTDGADPVEIALPDGGTLLMRGSADKVDEAADGTLYVTDIKSGGASSFAGLGEDDPVLGGSKLQLPVYAQAVRAAHGTPESTVEAAYWFVRKDKGRIAVPLTDVVEQVYAQTLQTIVAGIRGGLFPARPPEGEDFAFVQCAFCNPDAIGHGGARDRWERKKRDRLLAELVQLIEPLPADDTDGGIA